MKTGNRNSNFDFPSDAEGVSGVGVGCSCLPQRQGRASRLAPAPHRAASPCPAGQPHTRSTVISAVKFLISDQPHPIDPLLKSYIGEHCPPHPAWTPPQPWTWDWCSVHPGQGQPETRRPPQPVIDSTALGSTPSTPPPTKKKTLAKLETL